MRKHCCGSSKKNMTSIMLFTVFCFLFVSFENAVTQTTVNPFTRPWAYSTYGTRQTEIEYTTTSRPRTESDSPSASQAPWWWWGTTRYPYTDTESRAPTHEATTTSWWWWKTTANSWWEWGSSATTPATTPETITAEYTTPWWWWGTTRYPYTDTESRAPTYEATTTSWWWWKTTANSWWEWGSSATTPATTYETGTAEYITPWWWWGTTRYPYTDTESRAPTYEATTTSWWWWETTANPWWEWGSSATTPATTPETGTPLYTTPWWWWDHTSPAITATTDDTETTEYTTPSHWWDRTTEYSTPWWWWGTTADPWELKSTSAETGSWWWPSTTSEPLSGCFQPSSCAELLLAGNRVSGVYTIYPRSWLNAKPFRVYCDMETDGGGWTVFQRRNSDWIYQISFTRKWEEYKAGFGELSREFWLGNDRLFVLTNQDNVELRVELEDWGGSIRSATYDHFSVGDKDDDYKTTLTGFKGDAGSSLFSNTVFVTYDKNDQDNCARNYKGGWWYPAGRCAGSINGIYSRSGTNSSPDGVVWPSGFRGSSYSLKRTEMKLRPAYFLKCAPIEKK